MKPFLLFLMTLGAIASVYPQTPKYSIASGEYQNFILNNTTQTLYGLGTGANGIGSNAGVIGLPILCQFPTANTKIKFAASGLHTATAIDVSGNVYFTGDNEDGSMGNGTTSGNSNSFVRIPTDNVGNPFTNVTSTVMASSIFTGGAGYGAIIYAIKADGTLWVWGNTKGGYLGDGTYGQVTTRPVQVNSFPAGTVITKIEVQSIAIALDSAGNVWTWAGNGGNNVLLGNSTPDYTHPHKLAFPSRAIDIAGGGLFSYALLADGSLYGWGLYQGYMGIGCCPSSGWSNSPTPILLNADLNLPKPISQISTNNTSTYVILSDGTLWAWGGNECGQIGNGQELNYAIYTANPAPYGGTTPEPYAWNWDMSTAQLQQHKPAQVGPGISNFVGLSQGVEAVFYKFAVDANGQIYSWGRNKYGVLANGVMDANYVNGNIGSIYPNSWDVPYITAINPFASGGKTIQSTSPYCLTHANTSPCSLYAIPANTKPIANPGTNQTLSGSTATLDGTLSSDNVAIVYYLWTQVSGPNTAVISIPSGAKANLMGLITGVYKFQLKVTDNGWMSDSATVTVTVSNGIPGAPVANAGSAQSISLPNNTVNLAGTGTEVNGNIVSFLWTQVSGPSTASISTPSVAQTKVSGLVLGVYTFQLKITDALGISATATVQVTVNPVAPGPPTASAGPDQTITLPTNTVTLTGSGSETNGTIVSYLWSQLSGPSTATMSSNTQAQTQVSGLVQGVYSFQLTVTDNSGIHALDAMKVTVSAAVVTGTPMANAGSDQTITLPTSTVTLSGSGSETNGTIVSYLWKQSSGPSEATISTPTQAQTAVSGLLQGVYTFLLTVTDNSGITANDVVKVTVNSSVVAGTPIANAGPDQMITLPSNTVNLVGSGTETNGIISSYLWKQESGPSIATISTPNQASTSVNGLEVGVYTFVIFVTDNSGVTVNDVVKVTVNAALIVGLPLADAGSDQTITLPQNSVTLAGSGSEVNGNIVSYLWKQSSGPAGLTISTPTQNQTTVTGLVAGVYTFLLFVTDNSGVSANDIVKITVKSTVIPVGTPQVSAGVNQSVTLPINSVTLTATASETNGTIVSYLWTLLNGPATETLVSANQPQTVVNGLSQGVYSFQIQVTDSLGVTATDEVKVTVNAAIVSGPPLANAGPDQVITLPTNSVTLTGSGSETNGSIQSYKWAQSSGPSTAMISSPGNAQTTVGNLLAGIYTFLLTVTDNSGVTANDVAIITVNAAIVPGPPVVDAGSNQMITLPANSVTLSASASETNGTIVSYKWTESSGPSIPSISTATQAMTAVTGLVQGVYSFYITVTDSLGISASNAVKVTVNPAIVPSTPVVDAGANQTITLPVNSVTLTGTASETNGTIQSYQWIQSSGPTTANILTPTQAQTTVSGLNAGVYVFQLTATDNSGMQASDVAVVTVNAALIPGLPFASAGTDQTITLPTNSTILVGTASESNGTIQSYQWVQTAGPFEAKIDSPASIQTQVDSLIAGQYTFALTVVDNSGISATATMQVTVNAAPVVIPPVVNQPPVANAGPNQTINFVADSPGVVTLDGSASYDPDGTIVQYQWVQTSGSGGVTIANSTDATASVYGLLAGVYTFQLTVTDNQGASSNAQVTITLKTINNQMPVAVAGNDTTLAYPSSELSLNGSSSYDSGGTITQYNWTQVSGPSNASLAAPADAVTSASEMVVGEYVFELTVTDNNSHTSTSLIHVIITTTLRTTEYINVFPNPFTGNVININGSVGGQGKVGVALYDLNGKRILNNYFTKQADLFQQSIQVPNLSKGCYILELQFEGKTSPYSFKLIKE